MDSYQVALSIVKKLSRKGHLAYFAGGWVRDFLLKLPSDDIDIATDAHPDVIKSLFKTTIPVGEAFGIIITVIGKRHFEVATFRKDIDYKDGRHPSRIEFSTPQEDARRRDFTINGMFYDPLKEEILDFVGGQEDLQKKLVRAIGDPEKRFEEDKLRMIRAVRLACRFNFAIEEKTRQEIKLHAAELFPSVAIERVWQELQKMASLEDFKEALLLLQELGLLAIIFPALASATYEDTKKNLYALEDIPREAPAISKILELFPEYSLENALELCKFLKLSNADMKFVVFLFEAKELLLLDLAKIKIEKRKWISFYADKRAKIALEIVAAHIGKEKKQEFLRDHIKRQQELASAIKRVKENNPLIKSHHLKKLGIEPSEKMGLLLREAEKIAIEENIEDKDEIIKRLKKSKIWEQ